MAGLVGYASSDEDEEVISQHESGSPKPSKDNVEANNGPVPASSEEHLQSEPPTHQSKNDQLQEPLAPLPSQTATISESSVPLGPSLPPIEGPSIAGDAADVPEDSAGLSSPYSANRALLHDLTLPSIPNLDIPPSPPGSPPPGASKKFQQFLALKKKGTHFNSKLEQSTALRNPSLMDKLMAFVDVEGASQYETTLPADLWDPAAFPDWSYRNKLRKSRETIVKEREAEKASGSRTTVDFVPSSSATPSGGGTASAGRSERRKGGWK